MSSYTLQVRWARGEEAFRDNLYSRRHHWTFDGGVEVVASSSPSVVPVPMSVAEAVDPEEAFVASLSSCHLLWFLSLAAKRKFCVDHYADTPVGTMGPNAEGRTAMLKVVLRPIVTFSGALVPTSAEYIALHHEAHALCFIANSVKTDVIVEPTLRKAEEAGSALSDGEAS